LTCTVLHETFSSSAARMASSITTWLLQFARFVGETRHRDSSTSPPRQRIVSFLLVLLEWILAWTTVFLFGIRYVLDYLRLRRRIHILKRHPEEWWSQQQRQQVLVPLCTLAHTRANLVQVSIQERWERLLAALVDCQKTINFSRCFEEWTDDDWVTAVHSSLTVRREASYFMYKLADAANKGYEIKSALFQERKTAIISSSSPEFEFLLSKLQKLWPRFLEFPESLVCAAIKKAQNGEDDKKNFSISLIVPVYKERVETIQQTLSHAFRNCQGDSQRIQVIIVCASFTEDNCSYDNDDNDTSICQGLQQQLCRQSSSPSSWGELKVVTLSKNPTTIQSATNNNNNNNKNSTNGGRGKTLNAGIRYAQAPIVSFLHADTLVPKGWDIQIQSALVNPKSSFFPHACAFTMGIDTSSYQPYQECDCNDDNVVEEVTKSNSTSALLGAEWLGMLRCYCGLPYGDSVLSFHKVILEYIGGYPEQPLMEDYELMDWLRIRSLLLEGREQLVLLRAQSKCSPRRWQTYGVAYTSLVNAVCIHRYRQQDATAEELFDFYYHVSSPTSISSEADDGGNRKAREDSPEKEKSA